MKTFLRFLSFFICAIWGVVIGVLVPLTVNLPEKIPQYVPAQWIITAVIGFVVPCFLIRFKLCKTAAVLTLCGAVSVLFMHFTFMKHFEFGKIVWLYFPLFLQTLAVVILAVLENKAAYRLKRYERQKRENAPAPSILGGVYENNKNSESSKKEKK